MTTNLQTNRKGSRIRRSRHNVSMLSTNTAQNKHLKGTQSTNSSKPSLLERMKPRSLLERLSDPISLCSTIGTENEHSAREENNMVKSEKIQGPTTRDTRDETETRETKLQKKKSTMNQY